MLEAEVNAVPVVSQEAPAQAAAVATPAKVDEGAAPAEKPIEKTYTQAEVNAISARIAAREERKRVRELEATVQRLEAERTAKAHPQASSTDAAPKREDFDDYEQFIRAEARYVAREEFKAAREAEEKAAKETKVKEESASRVKTFDERLQAVAKKYADFEDVLEVAKTADITDAMFKAMTVADEGAEIAYHFGKHPEEAHRIALLEPDAQAVEIGKLAVRIAAGAPAAPATDATPTPKPAPVSKAPEPIKPVGGSATVEKPWDQLSDKEFAERRRRQIAQRR